MDAKGTISPEELAAAQAFHGHKCPAMPQGLRAGKVAMELLGVSRARGGGELLAVIETGEHHFSGCFADGVMFATGCTLGKGNIEKRPLGKFGLTLVDTASLRAVRVVPKYERMSKCLGMDFFQLRKQGVLPWQLDPQVIEPLIANVVESPWEEMFDVQHIERYPYHKATEVFAAERCAGCGELVVSSYATEYQAHFYCPVCLDEELHAHRR